MLPGEDARSTGHLVPETEPAVIVVGALCRTYHRDPVLASGCSSTGRTFLVAAAAVQGNTAYATNLQVSFLV